MNSWGLSDLLREKNAIEDLPMDVLQSFHPAIGPDVLNVLTLRGSLASRNVLGGTSPEQVKTQIARHRARLGKPQRNAISPAPAS